MLSSFRRNLIPKNSIVLLEAAEGQAKQTIKTDIPRYIISKLGLNRDPLVGKLLVATTYNTNIQCLLKSCFCLIFNHVICIILEDYDGFVFRSCFLSLIVFERLKHMTSYCVICERPANIIMSSPTSRNHRTRCWRVKVLEIHS